MVTSSRDHLDITVEPKNISRALLFMDTFIKLLRARGHDIVTEYRGTYILIKDERVKIQLREKARTVINPGKNWPSREFHPTGILSFKSEGYFDFEWKDGEKKKLEGQLSNILAKLETKIDELHEIQRVKRERREEEEREKRLKEEYKKRQEMELVSFKKLLNKSVRWKEVQVLREFLNDAEARALSSDQNSEEFKNWLLWARRKADWYDPYMNVEDELLKSIDKDALT